MKITACPACNREIIIARDGRKTVYLDRATRVFSVYQSVAVETKKEMHCFQILDGVRADHLSFCDGLRNRLKTRETVDGEDIE